MTAIPESVPVIPESVRMISRICPGDFPNLSRLSSARSKVLRQTLAIEKPVLKSYPHASHIPHFHIAVLGRLHGGADACVRSCRSLHQRDHNPIRTDILI